MQATSPRQSESLDSHSIDSEQKNLGVAPSDNGPERHSTKNQVPSDNGPERLETFHNDGSNCAHKDFVYESSCR